MMGFSQSFNSIQAMADFATMHSGGANFNNGEVTSTFNSRTLHEYIQDNIKSIAAWEMASRPRLIPPR